MSGFYDTTVEIASRRVLAVAMKKADMESHYNEYSRLILEARSEIEKLDYRKAIRTAESSWGFIDGMLQYEKRFLNSEKVSVQGISVVLSYSPFLLDFEPLDRVENFISANPRVRKNSRENLVDELQDSRECLVQAYSLWDRLEKKSLIYRDELKQQSSEVREIIDFWKDVGIGAWIPVSDRQVFRLVTHLQEIVRAKCNYCGVCVQAPKTKLLDLVVCPKCKQSSVFTLLTSQVARSTTKA
ncbi:MAG: hypothetical protein KDA68_05170 [Planctomycetaceae bacterium]|nr:hypothetical protein [Planctomycetaceae bacterium]